MYTQPPQYVQGPIPKKISFRALDEAKFKRDKMCDVVERLHAFSEALQRWHRATRALSVLSTLSVHCEHKRIESLTPLLLSGAFHIEAEQWQKLEKILQESPESSEIRVAESTHLQGVENVQPTLTDTQVSRE